MRSRGAALAFGALVACSGPRTTLIAPDFSRGAEVATSDGALLVVHRGVGPPVAAIAELRLSPDAAHVAYVASPCRWRDVGMPSLGRDGAVCEPGAGWWLVRDHRIDDRRWDGVGELTFAADGRLAFVARRGERVVVMVDDRGVGVWDDARALRFDDAGRLVYFARAGAGWSAVVDGQADRRWPWIDSIVVRGEHRAYVARDETGFHVVHDDVAHGPFEAVGAPVLDAAGARLAFGAREGGQWHMRAGEVGPAFLGLGSPVFTAAGSIAYLAKSEDGWRLHGMEGGRVFTRASDLTLEGARWAHLARHDGGWLVVSDRGEQRFELVVDGTLVFASDGRRWGCVTGSVAERKLTLVAEDGVVRPTSFAELVAVSDSAPSDDLAARDETLRRWVRAELDAGRAR